MDFSRTASSMLELLASGGSHHELLYFRHQNQPKPEGFPLLIFGCFPKSMYSEFRIELFLKFRRNFLDLFGSKVSLQLNVQINSYYHRFTRFVP